MTSKLIINGKILEDDKLVSKNILIKENKIGLITNKTVSADEIIDAKNKIILPGIIDPHVHMREPGLTHKEDFFTGSIAAAAGGITTFIDMPNTKPATITVKDLKEKRGLAKKSIVNYGFHFGSTPFNIGEIKKACSENIASVKVFMDATTGNMLIENKEVIANIMLTARLVTVHAEGVHVKDIIEIAKFLNKKVYICHVSSAEEISYARENKKENQEAGGNCYVEVTPHHLFLTEKDAKKMGAFASMKPLLKTKKDQDALWKAVEDGIVDTIGTDHAPHTVEEKKSGQYPWGVPGVETSLALMLDAVNRKKIGIARLQEIMCENPAKIFGIKNKGIIKEGYDADLVVVDMGIKKKVDNKRILSKCGWSPFDGFELKGWPVMTIVNGNIVMDNGKINKDSRGKEAIFL